MLMMIHRSLLLLRWRRRRRWVMAVLKGYELLIIDHLWVYDVLRIIVWLGWRRWNSDSE
jgi:hypothetical protein